LSRTSDHIHIPPKEEDAILAFMRVKSIADMPRAGAHPMKAKKAK
jgi:hypothetical protein